MPNILITGGLGFIGSHIALELLRDNFNVHIIDNLSNSEKSTSKLINKLSGKKVFFTCGDINDNKLLNSFFSNNKIDCVIHCAGFKSVRESISYPCEYYQNNISSTLGLLTSMKQHKIKKLIFSSSATIYDHAQKMPLNEKSKIYGGTNPYARTKMMIEQIFKDIYISDPKWSYIILRYFNPTGNDSSCLLGENPISVPNNLMPLINKAAFNLSKLTIFGDDYDTIDGTAVRDYVHVSDLAMAHVNSVKKILNTNPDFKIYNLGLGKGHSVLQVLKTYEKVNKIKINYNIGKRRIGDIDLSYTDNKLAKNELNWQPKYNLDDICLHSYEWMKNKIKSKKK